MINLRTIDENNFQACINLKATVDKDEFVDSVVYSLAEAWLYKNDSKPFAVYNDDQVIGFVSLYVGEGHYQIINFLIDDSFQNKGYGKDAAILCIEYLKSVFNAKTISVPVYVENLKAQKFWEKLGFYISDNIENGYIFMRMNL